MYGLVAPVAPAKHYCWHSRMNDPPRAWTAANTYSTYYERIKKHWLMAAHEYDQGQIWVEEELVLPRLILFPGEM